MEQEGEEKRRPKAMAQAGLGRENIYQKRG